MVYTTSNQISKNCASLIKRVCECIERANYTDAIADCKKIIDICNEGIELVPENHMFYSYRARAHHYLSGIFFCLGQLPDYLNQAYTALEDYNKVISLVPNIQKIIKNRQNLVGNLSKDYRQRNLLTAIIFLCKKRGYNVPVDFYKFGYCVGFAFLQIYKWMHDLDADPKEVHSYITKLLASINIAEYDDNIFEEFISVLEFAQHPKKYLDGHCQCDIVKNMDFLMAQDSKLQINEEFECYFMFSLDLFTKIFGLDSIPNNRVIFVTSLDHGIVMLKRNNKFYVYDANNFNGIKVYEIDELNELYGFIQHAFKIIDDDYCVLRYFFFTTENMVNVYQEEIKQRIELCGIDQYTALEFHYNKAIKLFPDYVEYYLLRARAVWHQIKFCKKASDKKNIMLKVVDDFRKVIESSLHDKGVWVEYGKALLVLAKYVSDDLKPQYYKEIVKIRVKFDDTFAACNLLRHFYYVMKDYGMAVKYGELLIRWVEQKKDSYSDKMLEDLYYFCSLACRKAGNYSLAKKFLNEMPRYRFSIEEPIGRLLIGISSFFSPKQKEGNRQPSDDAVLNIELQQKS